MLQYHLFATIVESTIFTNTKYIFKPSEKMAVTRTCDYCSPSLTKIPSFGYLKLQIIFNNKKKKHNFLKILNILHLLLNFLEYILLMWYKQRIQFNDKANTSN